MHPLDGISDKIRSTLKVYDNENGIQSCTFGSDYAVANVMPRCGLNRVVKTGWFK